MNFLLLLLQTADAPSSWPWYVKLLVTLLALFMAALGFYLGRLWTNLRYRREKRDRESAMFNLEKSLADFFEHEKSKLIKEKIALEREVERLEKRVEEFRKKAVGGSKFGKDARTDMLMSLLMENEDLIIALTNNLVRTYTAEKSGGCFRYTTKPGIILHIKIIQLSLAPRCQG